MKILRLFSCLAAVALVGVGAAFTSIHSSAADMNKQVTIDGSKANKDTQSMYRGLL